MARFDYLEARTLRRAISVVERHGDKARIVAGSTDSPSIFGGLPQRYPSGRA